MTGINIENNKILQFLFNLGLIKFTGVWNNVGRIFEWVHAPELKNGLTEELNLFVHDPEPKDEDDRFWWSQRHWTYTCINRPNFPVREPMHLIYYMWSNEVEPSIAYTNIEIAFRNFDDFAGFWNNHVWHLKDVGKVRIHEHCQPFPCKISMCDKELVSYFYGLFERHSYAIPE